MANYKERKGAFFSMYTHKDPHTEKEVTGSLVQLHP